MARIKIKDGGDRDKVLSYLAPIVGVQAITTATVAGYVAITVALTTIKTTDIVLAQILSNSSVNSFIVNTAITDDTGFVVKTQVGTEGTLVYAVYHPNA